MGTAHYERLEFLGDSVLGMVVCDHLYRRDPPLAEGEMTRQKIRLVCGATLANAARELELQQLIAATPREIERGGTELPGVLADALEAVLAVVYLCQGWDGARRFVQEFVVGAAAESVIHPKTCLQERLQGAGRPGPEYRTSAVGPDHEPTFHSVVYVEGQQAGEGSGPSKKAAETAAAEHALAQWPEG